MAKIKEKNGEPRTNKYSVAPFIKKFYNEYYSIEEYPEEKCAAFNQITDRWGIFGNFARTPLVIDDVPFKSSEHLFQTMKFKDADIVKKENCVYIRKLGKTVVGASPSKELIKEALEQIYYNEEAID